MYLYGHAQFLVLSPTFLFFVAKSPDEISHVLELYIKVSLPQIESSGAGYNTEINRFIYAHLCLCFISTIIHIPGLEWRSG
jgi:hypothetical protein